MPRVYEGSHDGKGLKIGLVVARFNAEITASLARCAIATLEECGVATEDIVVSHVPGAFELAVAGETLFETQGCDAVIALGCVIRGETTHYDFVCKAATDGVLSVGLSWQRPFIFGVLTTENGDQARARSVEGPKNKGRDCALAAVEMVRLAERLRSDSKTGVFGSVGDPS